MISISMLKRSFVGVVLVAAVATSSGVTFAQQPAPDVASAENAYAAVDFAQAVNTAEKVLKQSGLSHDTLVRATRVAGLSRAALGDGDQAKEHFVALLAYEPDFKVDSKLGPRFQEPFSEARAYWLAQGRKPGMEVQPLLKYTTGGVLKINTRDPMGKVKTVSVGYRWAPSRDYVVSALPLGAQQVDIPEARSGSTRLEYFVKAVDARDNAIFEDGVPESPKSVFVTEPPRAAGGATDEKRGFFASPVTWVTGGALLVGAGVLAFVMLRPTTITPATQGRTTFGPSCGGVSCD